MKNVNVPVIKQDSSFSIILLRNERKAVHFKLNSFLVKSFILFFLLFSAASGTAGYAAHYYWKKYTNLQRERSELAAKLGENRRQLGRFAGIELIQETQSRTSMSGVGVAANGKTSNGPTQGDPARVEMPQSAVTPAVPVAELPATQTLSAATAPSPGPEPSRGTSDTTGQGGREEDLKPNTAVVADVTLRPSGPQRINLSFDLSNKEPQANLNGRATLTISTKNGEKHEITDVSRSSLRFIISRYKRINATFNLPEGIRADDVETVHITINTANMVPATFSFPMRTS